MQPAGIHHSPIFHIRKQSRVHNLLSEYLGEPTSWDRGPCRSQEDGDSRTCIENRSRSPTYPALLLHIARSLR